jgi:benzoyl-CoA reductase/2-hydroxyglutaryl-CoA dehydratase subunit BcrC/BadD/HgdB
VASQNNYLVRSFSNIGDGTGGFEEVAHRQAHNYLNYSLPNKIEDCIRICKEHKCNGAIFQDNRGCREFVFGFYDIMRALEDKLGIPCLCYESNSADMRFWSDEEVRSKVDAFLDLLEGK